MSEQSEETYTPQNRFLDNTYEAAFDSCFQRLWTPAQPKPSGWTHTLRECITRHAEAFKIVSSFNKDIRTFNIPSFASTGEEEEEAEEEDEE